MTSAQLTAAEIVRAAIKSTFECAAGSLQDHVIQSYMARFQSMYKRDFSSLEAAFADQVTRELQVLGFKSE